MFQPPASAGPAEFGLVRAIGRWDLVAILINAVIGAGIFGLPAHAFGRIGSYSIGAWAVCALIMGLVALCSAEVGSRFAQTGGPYLYTYTAFGPTVGFMVGWLSWVSRLFSFATIGNLAVNYAGTFRPSLTEGMPRFACISAIAIALTTIVLTGVRRSAIVNNVLTACKLLLLCGFVTIGLFFIEPVRFSTPRIPPLGDFQAALLLMTFAFIGIESAMINAGEMRSPRRDVPFALGTGLAVIALLYILIQIVCIGTLPGLASSERPVGDAAARILGPVGAQLVSVGALVTMFGTLFAVLLTGSRLPFALAEQGQLPAFLCSVDRRFRAPRNAILITAVLAWLLTLYTSFLGALTATALTRLVGYATTCAALIALRARESDVQSPGFRAPCGRAVAVLAVLACTWLMFAASGRELFSVAVIAVAGAALGWGYALLRRRRLRLSRHGE